MKEFNITSRGPDEEHDTEEFGSNSSFGLNSIHNDHELFKEEDSVVYSIVNVRLVDLPRKSGQDWEIMENKRVALVLKGTRFTNNEKQFLKTVEGMKFIISGYKNGWKSVSKFKLELKSYV